MGRDFVISDLHIGHEKALEFRMGPDGKPFESTDAQYKYLCNVWNAAVSPEDTVYVLGDAFFKKVNIHKISVLNGKKILIAGNHDHYYSATNYEKVFHRVYGVLPYAGGVMTHVPIHPSQLDRWQFNLHGHLHQAEIMDKRYINCCIEHVGYAPVLLDQLIKSRGY